MAKKKSSASDAADEARVKRFFKVNADTLRAAKRALDRTVSSGDSAAEADARSDLVDAVDQVVAPNLTDQFVLIDPFGAVTTKAEMVKNIKTGDFIFNNYKRTQLKVTIVGDAAVTRSVVDLKGNLFRRDVGGKYHEVHCLVKQGDEWRLLTSQMTLITEREKVFPKPAKRPKAPK
jgi:hypothetical protein